MSGYDGSILYRPINSNNIGSLSSTICNWFKHMKMYKIVLLILTLLFAVPMLAHYYILNVSVHFSFFSRFSVLIICFKYLQVESNLGESDVHRSRSQLDAYEDFSSLRASDLKLRIEEMLRIKVNDEI